MADIDDDIDRLYQGPLDAFTDARNALAKTAKRPDVKTLQKPSLPAWVVNQLHWHRHAALDRLVTASEAVRKEHGKALSGRPADVRAAEQAHRDVVREVLAEARTVLTEAGHPITPATLDAVRDTLQALPSPEANGRLARPLAPYLPDEIRPHLIEAKRDPLDGAIMMARRAAGFSGWRA